MNQAPIPDEWFKLGPFTVFDTETTGMSPTADRIVELAAVRVEADGQRTTFHSLVNPGRPIPFALIGVHGITDEMVADAPTFSEVGPRFLAFAADSTLVAHNARFDLSFLQESLCREGGGTWSGKTLDTIRLMKMAYPGMESYSLAALRKAFALDDDPGPAHRAYADVQWTVDVLAFALRRLLNQQR